MPWKSALLLRSTRKSVDFIRFSLTIWHILCIDGFTHITYNADTKGADKYVNNR